VNERDDTPTGEDTTGTGVEESYRGDDTGSAQGDGGAGVSGNGPTRREPAVAAWAAREAADVPPWELVEDAWSDGDMGIDAGPARAVPTRALALPGGTVRGSPDDSPEMAEVRQEVIGDVQAFFEGYPDESIRPPEEAFDGDQWFDFEYLRDYDEVQRYWVTQPYAYVSVLYDPDRKRHRYHVTEPVLDAFEEYVRSDLTRTLRDSLMYEDLTSGADRQAIFEEKARELITDQAGIAEAATVQKLLYYLLRDFVHYGEIDPVMNDPYIEDISCDGHNVPLFVYHGQYRDLRTNLEFTEARLNSFVVRLAHQAGKHVSVSSPLVDASLADGSRIQLTFGADVSTRGSNFTIRRFSDVPMTPVDLINLNTFSVGQMAYFWLAIENNKSLIFAGGTGSGKTTSLNAISFFIPPDSKVVSIEDTREITLPHDNWVQSVARRAVTASGQGEVSTYNLLQASLRQRPEYLLVGEIRTEQSVALTFFQAIATGHTAYTTVHADSVEGALSRLQNPPLSVPVQMLDELDIIAVQQQIFLDEERVRRTDTVTEIITDEDHTRVGTNRVFERDPLEDHHDRVGDSTVMAEIAESRGWSETRLTEEIENRERVLQYLVDADITTYRDVAATIHTFKRDPSFVLEAIEADALEPATLPME
jgi:flagellar protein FlaI